MRNFRGKVAAITGAGSGIGRGLAIALAERGVQLALSDVDARSLEESAALARDAGRVRITVNTVDVADRAAVETWADMTASEHGRVNLVVNNAGVGLMAAVEPMSYDSFEWLMDINFWGVVHGTKAFLPHLKRTGDGHIVNVSSVFGLVGIPTQAAYNSAKFAVRGFTESLRIELDLERCGVSATCVHPGGVKTNIARAGRYESPGTDVEEAIANFDKVARTTPAQAAAAILRAVEKNRRRCLVGADAHIFNALAHLPAGLNQRLLGRLLRDGAV